MAWVLLDINNIVEQKQQEQEDGFIEATDDVICGQVLQTDGTYMDPPISVDQEQSEFRYRRDVLLLEADKLIFIAEDNGQDTTALRSYRQALRDATIDWIMPTKP